MALPLQPAPGVTRMPPGPVLAVTVPAVTETVRVQAVQASLASTSTVTGTPTRVSAVSSTASGVTVTVTVAVANAPVDGLVAVYRRVSTPLNPGAAR